MKIYLQTNQLILGTPVGCAMVPGCSCRIWYISYLVQQYLPRFIGLTTSTTPAKACTESTIISYHVGISRVLVAMDRVDICKAVMRRRLQQFVRYLLCHSSVRCKGNCPQKIVIEERKHQGKGHGWVYHTCYRYVHPLFCTEVSPTLGKILHNKHLHKRSSVCAKSWRWKEHVETFSQPRRLGLDFCCLLSSRQPLNFGKGGWTHTVACGSGSQRFLSAIVMHSHIISAT